MNTCEDRIRVLHITPSFGVGGAEQMTSHLMVGLSESHDVSGAGLYRAMNTSIESRLNEARIPLWHLNKRPGFDPRIYLALDRVFRQVRPQVVHTHLSVLRYALPALVFRRIPVVIHTLHNLAQYENDWFGRAVQQFAFRGAVIPVAISSEVALSFRHVYGVECPAMVPNCIPVEKYRARLGDRELWRTKLGLDSESTVFICIGRLEPQKNPLLLVRAFADLNDPSSHLVMLGEGSLRDRILACVRDLRITSRVHLLGERPDVAECLSAADVFVLSSDWEGNPLAVMEAMAASLPVVATAVGGVPELVRFGREGYLVPAGDRKEFTAAIRALLENRELRQEMSRASLRRAVSEFSVERMTAGYAHVYRNALNEAIGAGVPA
jgi:glycosyltransferase involved in cell wall biosynthesis